MAFDTRLFPFDTNFLFFFGIFFYYRIIHTFDNGVLDCNTLCEIVVEEKLWIPKQFAKLPLITWLNYKHLIFYKL